MPTLPTAEDLERLPMRAVVAYAARTARRISSELRGVVPDNLLDNALDLIDTVWMTNLSDENDQAYSVVRAAERVAGAYADAPDDKKSPEKFLMVFPLVHAALAAMHTMDATTNPSNASHHLKSAVDAAQRVIHRIETLNSEIANTLREAARSDYELLLREYGVNDEIVIGEPVTCFHEK